MENLQPRIRFKGFYGDWEKAKLKDIADINMGQSPNSENYTDDDSYPVLIQGNQDIKNGKVVPRIYTKEITKKAEKNDLILTVRAPVGEVAVNSYNSVIGRGVCSIKGNKFIYYDLFKKKDHYWDKLSSGSTFKSINSNDIKNSKINYPSLKEQEKIGDLFERLDLLIEKQEKYLALNKKLKKSLLQKLFPKKGEDYPELRFDGFEGKWKLKKLKDVGKIKTGKTPSTYNDDYYSENGILFITPTDIEGNIIENSERKLSKFGVSKTNIAPKNSILMTCIASIGKNAITYQDVGFNQQINSLSLDDNNNPYFFLSYSYHISLKMKSFASAGMMENVNKTTFSNIKIKLPSLKEQEKIGSLFKSLDEKIKKEEEKLSSYKDLKKSLLQKIFV